MFFFCHLTAFRSFYTAIIIIIRRRRRRRRRITKLTIKTYLQLISLKKKKKNIESKHYLQVISFHMFLFISIKKKKFISIKKKRKFITVKKNSFQLITMVIIYFFNNDNNVELDSQLQLAACGLGPSCSNDG